MANKTHHTKTRGETRTGIEGKDVSPNQAGAHGAPQGEMRTDTASGLSGDKGVQQVGDASLPTGRAHGLKIGEPGVTGAMGTHEDRTMEGQLTDKGFARSDTESRAEHADRTGSAVAHGDAAAQRPLPEAERLSSEGALPETGSDEGSGKGDTDA